MQKKYRLICVTGVFGEEPSLFCTKVIPPWANMISFKVLLPGRFISSMLAFLPLLRLKIPLGFSIYLRIISRIKWACCVILISRKKSNI